MLVNQHNQAMPKLENAYQRAVSNDGNIKAKQIMQQIFDTCDASWRGIGIIPNSGMKLKQQFHNFEAVIKFDINLPQNPEPKGCSCGEILMGIKTPEQCSLYKKVCTPVNPVGPCMVSSEGSCAAFYNYN